MTMHAATAPIPQQEVILPPRPNGNGAEPSPPVIPADMLRAAVEADPDVRAVMKWRERIFDLRDQMRASEQKKIDLQGDVGAEQVKVNAATELLHKAEAKRDQAGRAAQDYREQILLVALGGSSDKLDFDGVTKGKPAEAVKSDQQLQEAFDALSLSAIGVRPNLCDKLEADGIRNGKELRLWIQDTFRRQVKGVGKQSVEKLADLLTEKMLAMHEEAKKANPIHLTKPDEKSGSLDETVSRQIAQSDAPFDDDAIKMDTAEGIIKHAGVCFVDVAQRAGGKWAARWRATLGKKTIASVTAKTSAIEEWEGMHPSRVHAITTGVDAVWEFVHNLRGKLSGKAKKQADEIVRLINAVDQKLAADAKAGIVADDIKAFWEGRPARDGEAEAKTLIANKGRRGRKS